MGVISKTKDWLKKIFSVANAGTVFVIILVIAYVAFTIDALNRNYNLQHQVDQGELDNQVSEIQNENLKLEQSYYKTDEYLEVSARSLLGKAKPGEHLVILPKVESGQTQSKSTSSQVTAKSNVDQWIEFLLGKHS